MREDICSIPITEVFEKNDGCPICRVYDILEARMVDYITGAAMMEPDIRVETNKVGFCRRHFDKMGECKTKLAFSLVLNTHLDRLMKLSPQEIEKELPALNSSCFVCEKMEWGATRLVDTVFKLYETEPDFRKMFADQPYICLDHYELLLRGVKNKKLKKTKNEFKTDLYSLYKKRGEKLCAALQKFSMSFDYRADHSAPMPEEVRNSLIDSVDFLAGRK